MCSPRLMRDSAGVAKCVATCESTIERTPVSPPSIAMLSVAAPNPWATTWTPAPPVAQRTSRAAGLTADLRDRGGEILARDVVAGVALRVRRPLDAGAVVEQPDVVAALA